MRHNTAARTGTTNHRHLNACAILLLTSLWFTGASADNAVSAKHFVESVFSELLSELNALGNNKNPHVIQELFLGILSPHIDYQGLARWTLREHWQNANSNQQQQFLIALKRHLIKTYASALSFDEHSALTINDEGRNKKHLTELSGVLEGNKAQSLKVNFRLISRANQWQLFDVAVHGISVAKTLRADFAAIASRGGIEAVVNALDSESFQLISQR